MSIIRLVVTVRRWPDRVTITNAQGIPQFEIAGIIGSSHSEQLSLRTPEGSELAIIRRHVPTN
jgi:hypothetical protein